MSPVGPSSLCTARRFRGIPWRIVPFLCVALALTLRVLGLRFGLPYFHHWDEGWVAENTSYILWTPDAQPKTYQYGAPLSLLSALLFRLVDTLAPRLELQSGDQALLRLLGRIVTAVISSSGAFATYLAAQHAALGERSGHVRGAYAALLYATAAELVSHGRYALTDSSLVALVAWSLACAALFLRSGKLLWAIRTTLFAALAVSFKVTALAPLVIPAGALGLPPGARARFA